jgi:hypothetical protein
VAALLVIAGMWLSTQDGPEIRVPPSWLDGEDSSCTLQPEDVERLLGNLDLVANLEWRAPRHALSFYWKREPMIMGSLACAVGFQDCLRIGWRNGQMDVVCRLGWR